MEKKKKSIAESWLGFFVLSEKKGGKGGRRDTGGEGKRSFGDRPIVRAVKDSWRAQHVERERVSGERKSPKSIIGG